MDFLRHNRAAAWAALVLCMIGAVYFGALRSVASLRAKADRIYSSDTARYGCVKEDLNRFLTFAAQLCAMDADGSMEQPLSDARLHVDSPFDQSGIRELYDACTVFYNRILAEGTTGARYNTAVSCYYEMTSCLQRIAANEAYRNAAEKYNHACRSFPGILARHTDEAALYYA